MLDGRYTTLELLWLTAMMADELFAPESENRAEWRAELGAQAELRAGTPRWRKVRMTNLSPHGFRVTAAAAVNIGESVFLRFAGLSLLNGRVRWIEDHEMGCEFEQPLSPYVFDHIVRTLEAQCR